MRINLHGSTLTPKRNVHVLIARTVNQHALKEQEALWRK